MPYFRGDDVIPMLNANSQVDRYSWIFTPSKWSTVIPLLLKDDLKYSFALLACFGFLPLLAPPLLLAGLADIIVIFLSSYSTFRSMNALYGLPITPPLTLAACSGFMYAKNRLRHAILYGFTSMSAGCCAIFFSSLPLPYAANFFEFTWRPKISLTEEEKYILHDIKKLMPSYRFIYPQPNIGMFFTEFDRGHTVDTTAYVMRIDSPRKKSLAVSDIQHTAQYINTVAYFLTSQDYKIIYWHAPWLVIAEKGTEIATARSEAKSVLEQFSATQEMIYKRTLISNER